MHDFFYCLRMYESALPRCRLFLCFLGCNHIETGGGALDQETLWLLGTQRALGLYLDLVCAIRLEAASRGKEASALFPSSETVEVCQRDFWYEDEDLLAAATRRWVGSIKAVGAESFTRHLTAIATGGRVDVDDYLWLVMMQWCELMKVFTKTAGEKLGWLNRQESSGRTTNKGYVMVHKVTVGGITSSRFLFSNSHRAALRWATLWNRYTAGRTQT